MCETCGCGDGQEQIIFTVPGEESEHHHHSHDKDHEHQHEHGHHTHDHSEGTRINIERDILGQNKLIAERNRGFFEAKNILCLNLMSSPGSGKTLLLEKTIKALLPGQALAVIEGDQQTLNDANRIQNAGAPVIQVNTGNGCHLDSSMINKALKKMELKNNSFLFIENVGNLVCPSLFDLGESKRVVIISTTEGEDKPIKYPTMFEHADICVINKTDLLPYLDYNIDTAKQYALQVNHHLEFIELSAKTREGMENWINWLKKWKK